MRRDAGMINVMSLLLPTVAGLVAGYGGWLAHREGIYWGFGTDFLSTLLLTGVFSALLLGATQLLAVTVAEGRAVKAIAQFLLATGVALAITMTGAVLYALLRDWLVLEQHMSAMMLRTLWWATLATTLSVARAILYGTPLAGLQAFAGLFPALLLGGLLFDTQFGPREQTLLGLLLLGGLAGLSLGMTVEFCKYAWLEEHGAGLWKVQFLLDRDTFSVGANDQCDFTVPDDLDMAFEIHEREGFHVLQVLPEAPMVTINGARVRCRTLVEGDALQIGTRVFIYHNRFATGRDAMLESAGVNT